ncbi:translation initiation factor eIF-2B [Salinirarus marinus]|uniref:translation initiation factor eIF-2B n=1 Tax=Salinirarus marinus TaxID=3068310 RepID=UPI003C6C7E7A
MIDETIEEIRRMKTHSSSVVAVKAARSLSELLDREYRNVDNFERDLERNASALRRANPSHASLYKAMREVVDDVVGEADSVDEAKALTSEAIDRVVETIQTGKRRAAANLAETFDDTETLLTHDYSSTVLEAISLAAEDGHDLTVYVTEARPRYLGRKTARRLADVDGVEPHLAVDSASGHFLSECDRAVLGMTCVAEDTLYNRVGTFPLVSAATRLDVPVVVAGSESKVIEDGFVFENETRSPAEVMREPVEGIHVENPAYDATPVELLDAIVTDDGVRDP